MKSDFVAVIDSGAGGLSVVGEMKNIMPCERYLYLGDNGNAPYGNRTPHDLVRRAFALVDEVKEYGVKALVVACNTLSVTALGEISEYAGVPTVGVFPPVETAVMEGGRTLVLATERTAACLSEFPVTVLGLKSFVSEIEARAFRLTESDVCRAVKDAVSFGAPFVDEKGYYDRVILGCTHYCFVKDLILAHFRPRVVTSGNLFAAKKLYKILSEQKSLGNSKGFEIKFIGKDAETNKYFWVRSGFAWKNF